MSERTWLYVVDDSAAGPVAESVLVQLAAAGHVDGSTLVWTEGLDRWTPLAAAPIDGLTLADSTVGDGDLPEPSLPVPNVPSRWSTIAFYLGWLSLAVLPGPLALAAGVKAVQEQRRLEVRTGIRSGGRGGALFGLAMGTLATILLAWVIVTAAID